MLLVVFHLHLIMKSKLPIVSILVLFCIFCSSCNTKADKSFINNWVSYPITLNMDSINRSNHLNADWSVYLKNDSVRAIDLEQQSAPIIPLPKADSNRQRSKGELSTFKVNDGYLSGSFRGEWGGDLYWFSNDGNESYKISEDEIVQFIERKGEIYAIQGLDYGGMSEGSILKIFKENNKWIAKEFLKLSSAPEAIALDSKQNFIIMTYSCLLKIDENLNMTLLVDKGMQINDLIIKDNIVYAGMRYRVYKYNLLTKKQEWLLPN